jgi:hypothetical protein
MLVIAVLVLAGGVFAQNPPKQQPAPPKPPLIVRNADGTLTVQSVPPKEAKAGRGLVIPKQVVIPFVSQPQAPKH